MAGRSLITKQALLDRAGVGGFCVPQASGPPQCPTEAEGGSHFAQNGSPSCWPCSLLALPLSPGLGHTTGAGMAGSPTWGQKQQEEASASQSLLKVSL